MSNVNIVKIIFLIALLATNVAYSLELSDLKLEAMSGLGTNRSPYLVENEERTGELNLQMTIKKDFIYSTSKVYSTIGARQFAHVGLYSELGARYEQYELFINHRSDHALDSNYGKKYPNINSIGIRIDLK